MVDATDSKSVVRRGVKVRLHPPAPIESTNHVGRPVCPGLARFYSPMLRRTQTDEEPPRGGEEESFDHLIERYYRPISYFFANRGFSTEECRDLTQETFLGVFKGLGRFRRDSSVETWLFKIAANIWRNALRSRSADKRDGLEIPLTILAEVPVATAPKAGGPGDPLGNALADEQARLLREAIDELPAQMRRCLLLRIDHDMKYREIAAVLQVSIDTVKSQLFQAKERLKDKLVKHFPDLDS